MPTAFQRLQARLAAVRDVIKSGAATEEALSEFRDVGAKLAVFVRKANPADGQQVRSGLDPQVLTLTPFNTPTVTTSKRDNVNPPIRTAHLTPTIPHLAPPTLPDVRPSNVCQDPCG